MVKVSNFAFYFLFQQPVLISIAFAMLVAFCRVWLVCLSAGYYPKSCGWKFYWNFWLLATRDKPLDFWRWFESGFVSGYRNLFLLSLTLRRWRACLQYNCSAAESALLRGGKSSFRIGYYRTLLERDSSAFARWRYQSSAVSRMLTACFINIR